MRPSPKAPPRQPQATSNAQATVDLIATVNAQSTLDAQASMTAETPAETETATLSPEDQAATLDAFESWVARETSDQRARAPRINPDNNLLTVPDS